MYRGVTGSPVVTRNCIAMSPDYMYRVTTAVHNYRGVHIEAPMLYTDSTQYTKMSRSLYQGTTIVQFIALILTWAQCVQHYILSHGHTCSLAVSLSSVDVLPGVRVGVARTWVQYPPLPLACGTSLVSQVVVYGTPLPLACGTSLVSQVVVRGTASCSNGPALYYTTLIRQKNMLILAVQYTLTRCDGHTDAEE